MNNCKMIGSPEPLHDCRGCGRTCNNLLISQQKRKINGVYWCSDCYYDYCEKIGDIDTNLVLIFNQAREAHPIYYGGVNEYHG